MLAKKRTQYLKKLAEVKQALQYRPDTNPAEQALCDLGKLLGLESLRPEKEFGTGPDVAWRVAKRKAGVALEAKTNKKPTSQYQKKDDIGQFHDHAKWLKNKWPEEAFYKAIVGRKLAVSKDANPPDDLRIIPLEQFVSLANRLEALIQFVDASGRAEDLDVVIESAMRYLGLILPNCIESLESSLAIDLKQPEQLEIAL